MVSTVQLSFLHLAFLTTSVLVLVQGDIHEHETEAGTHCGNFTGAKHDDSTAETEHFHCTECLYPQNCLADNQCRTGTTGSTCEKCSADYHHVGSLCVKCYPVPWPAVSFGIYLLILVGTTLCHGFTDSVCTKVKLLCHFLQNMLLTLHIKIAWPENLPRIFSIINFGLFNSNILNPECLFVTCPSMSIYYIEWLTSLCIPIFIIILGKFLYTSMKQNSNQNDSKRLENNAGGWERQTTIRRLVVMVILTLYMPATLSCVRTFLCSDTIPKLLVLDHTTNVFLLDNDESCDVFIFQTIHFFASVYLVFMGLLLPPMLIFFTLRQKKWDLLYSKWRLYSPLYEAYKDRYCYWEAIPLLRKLVSIIVTEAYPFSGFIQTVIQLGMSACYLLAIIVLRPYRSCYWVHPNLNVHIFFEVVSNIVVCCVQGVGLTVVLGYYQESSDLVAAGAVCIVVVIWIVLMLALICETKPHLDLAQVDVPESSTQPAVQTQRKRQFKFWKKARVEQDPKLVERVNKNITQIDF
ncbi:uncharacterized protein LOC123524713 isoform X2 [Mercenaria mercenaria]|nr:uncharacterized protein LOC123524713 isoform X2 [Mercenaria mercenaria]XP_053394514.1 uncharacterized protein LOC123524713 isoform X2 [Mercenaria mercenaria]XP_053394515.1 uncharacterized protein LOC123524713 isoform X2 [Mercenaria mercenaria]XP_053394516.1 uncharacterized protein LOC123524713 isoform X2 [Mercenaria mercenaria]XP_053394517.1 uncharacterized protein LOC123524713 isoform X2 [Mercenaria mercenaria]